MKRTFSIGIEGVFHRPFWMSWRRMETAQHIRRPPSIKDVDRKVGFIGAGRMAQALSKGLSNSGLVKVGNMMCSDVSQQMLDIVSESVGIRTTTDNLEVVKCSDVVVIAVKPHLVPSVLKDVTKFIHMNHLIVSIAAGVTIQQMEKVLPPGTRLIRVMPNTPALIQCGASIFSSGSNTCSEDEILVQQLFSSIGFCAQLPEKQLDAVTGVSGSGPAYGFMAVEALADGGVEMGLPRDVAQNLAAQTLMGAAKMVLDTGKHPGELKDGVCSTEGTTIAAVHYLEAHGYRAALIGAVETATKRSQELAKNGDAES